jgi:glycosyltransferase involved in cell wall biosynthesis
MNLFRTTRDRNGRTDVSNLKVVYLSPLGELGGAERSLLDVMASVQQAVPSAKLDLIVAAEGPLIEQAQKLGVGVTLLAMPRDMAEIGDSGLKDSNRMKTALACAYRIPDVGWATWCYAKQLQRTIEALQPTLIHSNGNKFHLLTRLARVNGVPVLWHIRDFLTARPVMAPALRWASARASGAIAISQAVGRDARAVLRKTPLRVIYNAIDTDAYSPGPADGVRLDYLAGLQPAESGTVRVGLIAAFARWKGQDVFLDAVARLLHSGTGHKLRFYLIGGPIYQTRASQFSRSELTARATALGISSQVGFIGFQEETADIYRALDIVVHASTQPEPFGRTIIEAMACARPVIVSRAGGAAELFTENYDALGVQPCDAHALASAIAALVERPHRRLQMSRRARRTAVEKFSRARLGRELAALYAPFARGGAEPVYRHQVLCAGKAEI